MDFIIIFIYATTKLNLYEKSFGAAELALVFLDDSSYYTVKAKAYESDIMLKSTQFSHYMFINYVPVKMCITFYFHIENIVGLISSCTQYLLFVHSCAVKLIVDG